MEHTIDGTYGYDSDDSDTSSQDEEKLRIEAWNRYCSSFSHRLQSSSRILVLIGAGLSASSGIATYQGANSTWRGHQAHILSTRSFFDRNPSLTWEYYQHRRNQVLRASPNAGHFTLAKLAQRKPTMLTITQNVDDLSQRAEHPLDTLVSIHGSLLDTCCTNPSCQFFKTQKWSDHSPVTEDEASGSDPLLPECPLCSSLLRPAIVRFGDQFKPENEERIENWLAEYDTVDVMLVIGCAASVSPAADYIDRAKAKGARIAVFNTSYEHQSLCLGQEDWLFIGDASILLPRLLGWVN